MQYELAKQHISLINQMTPGDLIWQPAMAQYEDKINNTFRHLCLLLNKKKTNPPPNECIQATLSRQSKQQYGRAGPFQTLPNVEYLDFSSSASM